jgi:hypothetical protein
MARTTGSYGIGAIKAVIDGIDLTGITLNPQLRSLPIESRQSGTIVEFVYQQDLSGTIPKLGNIGRGPSTPGNIGKDDLFPTQSNPYDFYARIAWGTFGAVRPSFANFPEPDGGPTAVQEYTDAALTAFTPPDSNITFGGGDGVRGDSVAIDGLKPADANRDGTVNNPDFGVLTHNFYKFPRYWDTGDFNDDGFVGTSDFNIVINNFFTSSPSPAIVAVPEHSTLLLIAMASACLVWRR